MLALAPLARAGLIADVVIDAKQGISGAGRAFDETTHLSMAGENILPYKVASHRHTPEIEEQLAALDPAQPELPSSSRRTWCRSTRASSPAATSPRPARSRAAGAARAVRDAYAGEPFVEVARVPPGTRDVRETNFCRVFAAADAHTGKVVVLSAIDNLWKGTSSQAVQNLNVMFGLPESEGLAERRDAGSDASARAFFGSRWTAPAPAHVRELAPDAGLPAGFRAAGVACGIKPQRRPRRRDGRVRREQPVSAARFTATGTPAAPVLVSRERCRLERCARCSPTRAAPTPRPAERGLEDAAKTQGAAAIALGVAPARSCSARPERSAGTCRSSACCRGSSRPPRLSSRRDGDRDFQRAIQTTDAVEKRANLELELPSGRGATQRPVQGRGHDLAEVRDDAVLRRDRRGAGARDRRSAAGGMREALVRPLLGRRPALDQRHRRPDVLGCVGRARRARVRGRAALRRGSGRAPARARDHDGRRRRGRRRIARVVVRGGHADGVEAPRARSPTRRWSKRRCTAPTPTGVA